MEPEWLEPAEARPLAGEERFSSLERSVLDFWRWAFSDLRMNIVRGVLAEHLVAQALGDQSQVRHAWDNFDAQTPSGIRVEVKSSAYLQSWRQRRPSQIVFSGLTGRSWSSETNEWGAGRELRAGVYVFAIHTCRDPTQYDPLDLASWDFRVLGADVLQRAGQRRSACASWTSMRHRHFGSMTWRGQ